MLFPAEQRVHRTEGLFQWPFFIGWPAVAVSVVLALVGVVKGKAGLLVGAGVLALPFGLYLSANPGTPWGVGIPLAYFLAAVLVRWNKRRAAWSLVALALASLGWLAIVVFLWR